MKRLTLVLLVVAFTSCERSNLIPVTNETSLPYGIISKLSDTTLPYDKFVIDFNDKLYVISKKPQPSVVHVVDLKNNSFLGFFLGTMIGMFIMLVLVKCFINLQD